MNIPISQSEERNKLLDSFLKAVDTGIMITDCSGNILRVNESCEKIYGYGEKALSKKQFPDLVWEKDKSKAIEYVKSFSAAGKAEVIGLEVKNGRGEKVFIKSSAKLMEVGAEQLMIVFIEDISLQRQLETELKAANERLSSLINNLSLYLWSLDKDLRFVTANQAAKKIFKSSFDYDFVPGDHVMELYVKRQHRERGLWLEKYNAVLQTGRSQYFEITEIFYGRFLHVTAELHPIKSKGELKGISCLVRNDTNKYLKTQLNQALSNFKSKVLNVSTIKDLLWAITDEILAHLHLEDAVILMKRNQSLEIKTAHGSKRVGPKRINSPLSIPLGQGVTGNVALTGKSEIVNDVLNDPRYYEAHFAAGSEIAVPIKIGDEVVGVINCESSHKNFFRDIHLEILEEVAEVTAEKMSQIISDRKLKRMEELNRAVLNSTPNSYLLLNAKMEIESFNRTAQHILSGFAGGEVAVGKNYLDYVPENYKGEFKDFFSRAMEGEMITSERKYHHLKQGEVWARRTLAPAINRQKKIFGVTVILEDITKQKETENLILEQNYELRKTNQELDKFVYSVSHDLRSPVSSVMGINSLIKMSDDVSEIRQYNELIFESMERMDSFIRNILDYSRNSRAEVKNEEIKVHKLLDDILADHSYMEGFKNIEIRRIINVNTVVSDRHRLSIILSNLISNAIKYHDHNKQNRFVEVSITEDQKDFIIKVKDNGQGIKEEYLPNLFKMFYTANLRAKGSGIGLYILRETVNTLKGEVSVTSKPGKGTEFILKLPRLKVGEANEIPVN